MIDKRLSDRELKKKKSNTQVGAATDRIETPSPVIFSTPSLPPLTVY